MTTPANTAPRRRAWVWLAVVVAVAAGLRTRLLDIPLERDEGEYAYAGQLLRQGVPPYASAYTMKWPGTHVAYAAIMTVFGETPRGIHTGLIVVNAATMILVFLIARRVASDAGGIVAAAVFALLSISPLVEGFTANCEHFVVVPALGGVLLLLHATDGDATSPRTKFVFLSGLCLGLVPLFKQQGAVFSFFGGLYLLDCLRRQQPIDWHKLGKTFGWFCAAAATPFLTVCVWMFAAGVFDKFWLWTIRYPRSYASQVTWADVLGNFRAAAEPLFVHSWPLWSLAAMGLCAVLRSPSLRDKRLFVIGFALFSFFAVCPGFFFRAHYFVYVLPAAGILTACALPLLARGGRGGGEMLFRDSPSLPTNGGNNANDSVSTMPRDPPCPPFLRGGVLVAGFLVPVLVFLINPKEPQRLMDCVTVHRLYLFGLNPAQISRSFFPLNPFAASAEIAARIRELTPESGRVAIIGSEPQLPFLAQRRSATAFIYMYPLMENQPFAKQMQSEMIAEVEAARPECLVYVTIPASWIKRPFSRERVFDWLNAYLPNHYEIDSVYDIQPATDAIVTRDPAEIAVLAEYDYRVKIFRRRK